MLCENMPLEIPEPFTRWFSTRGWQPHMHQLEMLKAAERGVSSLLIAPTGGGKTLAGFLPSMVDLYRRPHKGLHTLYISPLKALAADIHRNLQAPIEEMGLDITVEMRTGDTSSSRRARQLKKPPHILLTTPESMELMLSYADADTLFSGLQCVVVDEIHSMAPGKRGHLTALCLAHLRVLNPHLRVSGLSATVAEPEKLAAWIGKDSIVINAGRGPEADITLLQTAKPVPWSGYMGSYALPEVAEAIRGANTSIIFVNTRAQAELVFQQLWEMNDDGLPIALHHGSLEREHRLKVEAAMNAGKLRAIVATASLDLGLDWGAVDLVLQIGAPKGISRLLQRIGRSNHHWNTPSRALLVPCNRFDMVECVATMDAIDEGLIDGDALVPGSLDVLAQFVMNSACGAGFEADALYKEIASSPAYRHVDRNTFDQIVAFVAHGGYSLQVYDRFQRIAQDEDGRWRATPVAMRRHRMNIGTIVEYETLKVSMRSGRARHGIPLGQIEEYFVQGLAPGDSFIFAGRMLKYKGIRDNQVEVEPSKDNKPKIPSFKGGRLPLSVSLAARVRDLMAHEEQWGDLPPDIREWLSFQRERSCLPQAGWLLIESFMNEQKPHMVFYTFAGRNANQTLGLLLSQRMEESGHLPLGFVANDYALAVWGLKEVASPEALLKDALSQDNCAEWIEKSQMAKRAFRDIALIAGLVERRYAGGKKTGRQVTISTDIIYDVLRKHEPDHILLRATREDVTHRLSDIDRLRDAFSNTAVRHVVLPRVSPLAIPLLVELGTETIKGEAQTVMLRSQFVEQMGEHLWKEAAKA